MEGRGAPGAIEYPVRDDEPMGETDEHRDALKDYAVNVLLDHFAGTPGIYVSGNNFLYYLEGDPKTVVSPDTYVVKGPDQRRRDTFKVWEEGGHLPCFVLEITSKTSRHRDLGEKMFRYRDDLEVPDYFLFDPFGEWIPEQLRGFRRTSPGIYTPIQPDVRGRLASAELGLELGLEDGRLRFYLPGAPTPLPTRAERAEQAEALAKQETAKAEQERVKAEQERVKAEQERVKAEQAEQRAQQAEAKAAESQTRAERAEAELARLRAELDQRE